MKVPGSLVLLSTLSCGSATTAPPLCPAVPVDDPAGVEAFNRAYVEATRRMDTPAIVAMWEDDGVSLLPATRPLLGARAIGAFVDEVMAQLPGAHLTSFEMTCTGIEAHGDWASEWCEEHQVVTFPGGKPPFVGSGKLLFVLHRGRDARWRLKREMWNEGMPAPKPG